VRNIDARSWTATACRLAGRGLTQQEGSWVGRGELLGCRNGSARKVGTAATSASQASGAAWPGRCIAFTSEPQVFVVGTEEDPVSCDLDCVGAGSCA
jgi:hypothetical protein